MEKEIGIYIHIPFCKKKCNYCDFISYPDKLEETKKYVDKLKEEINIYNFEKCNVTTIYIGGGTPSYIDSMYICEILQELRKKINFQNMEITIEVNPGTITENKLKDYKKSGINRLSIGLQSTNNKLLKQLGRIHKYEDFLSIYNLARNIGFQNINADLMIGLPNQAIQDIKEDLKILNTLNPEHISVYSLIVEEETVISKQIEKGILNLPDEDLERDMYWYVKDKLELAGYEHYEISNFAKNGKKSKHNLNCWEQKEYIGLGVSAHSYLNSVRYCNTNDLENYLNANFEKEQNSIKINENDINLIKENDVRIIEEIQNLEEKQKEYMLLGLRKIDGVCISKFKEKYAENPIYLYRKELEKLTSQGLIIVDGDFIRLTNKGLDLANLVWEEFI